MTIVAYMISCKERTDLRNQTVARLEATDWGQPPIIVLDDSLLQRKQDRQTINALTLLQRAIADGAEFILFLEDDLEFNYHLRHNLQSWFPARGLTSEQPFFASLYNPNIGETFRDDSRNYFIAAPESVYGSQAYLLSAATARYFVSHWDEVEGMQDIKMSRLAGRLGPIYYHYPSLVQHLGEVSVWGGSYHWAQDYDAYWMAGGPEGKARLDPARLDPGYSMEYVLGLQGGSLQSARIALPLVLELVRPSSVIDFGCATGAWLSVAQDHGVEEIWGVDADYVEPEMLLIPRDRFIEHDFRSEFHPPSKYDLALCLEIAEHLPEENAQGLIDSLVRAAPAVLFSAAIPHQGGLGHINEQWPEYWAAKFSRHDFVPIDCIRRKIWNDPNVCFWYRQNLLLFVHRQFVEENPRLRSSFESTDGLGLSLVHPDLYNKFWQ